MPLSFLFHDLQLFFILTQSHGKCQILSMNFTECIIFTWQSKFFSILYNKSLAYVSHTNRRVAQLGRARRSGRRGRRFESCRADFLWQQIFYYEKTVSLRRQKRLFLFYPASGISVPRSLQPSAAEQRTCCFQSSWQRTAGTCRPNRLTVCHFRAIVHDELFHLYSWTITFAKPNV